MTGDIELAAVVIAAALVLSAAILGIALVVAAWRLRGKANRPMVSGACESDVHSDTLGHRPKSKLQFLCDALRFRWGVSLARIILWELGICPWLRIRAILQTPEVRFGPTIPLTLSGRNLKTLYPVNNFLLACSEGIRQLHAEFPWAGNLEATMAARAFQRGVEWSMGSSSETHSEDVP